MSKRFIINGVKIYKDKLNITGEEVNHIKALRHKVGDKIFVNEFEIEILSISKDSLEGIILGKMPDKGVPKVNITLVQSYLKADKMEYVVQKAIELGVKEILPAITKNTVVKLNEQDKSKKKERLQKIAKEALQQCGRTDDVSISEIKQVKAIDWSAYDKVLVCHEVSNRPLKNVIDDLRGNQNIAVVIGPEGGLDNKEVETILALDNVVDISLGERILRAETASLAMLSILSYELE